MTSNYDRVLGLAVASGNLQIAKVAIKRGADVRLPDAHGTPLLTVAVSKGHYDVVELLLDSGASIDAHDTHGWTPLMHAAHNGLTPIVRLLLQRGADVEWEDDNHQTALTLAQWGGHDDVEKILKHGDVPTPETPVQPAPLPDVVDNAQTLEKLQGARVVGAPFRKRPPHNGGPR